jgi:hypothetical protein
MLLILVVSNLTVETQRKTVESSFLRPYSVQLNTARQLSVVEFDDGEVSLRKPLFIRGCITCRCTGVLDDESQWLFFSRSPCTDLQQ